MIYKVASNSSSPLHSSGLPRAGLGLRVLSSPHAWRCPEPRVGAGGVGEGPNLGSMPCPQPPSQPPRAIRFTLPAHHDNSPCPALLGTHSPAENGFLIEFGFSITSLLRCFKSRSTQKLCTATGAEHSHRAGETQSGGKPDPNGSQWVPMAGGDTWHPLEGQLGPAGCGCEHAGLGRAVQTRSLLSSEINRKMG